MMRQRLWLLLLMLSTTLTQCSKCKENVNPDDLLPPETQTGVGTFACRINGVVWKYKNPTGIFNLQATSSFQYYPNDNIGTLSLSGYRYDNNNNVLEHIGLYADSIALKKEVTVDSISQRLSMTYDNYQPQKNVCDHYFTKVSIDTSKYFYRQGKLEVTKLDIQTRIISGRFNCTIYQKNCDTLKITDGRFDFKF